MESQIKSIVMINGKLRLILTTEEVLQQKVLEELNGATCKFVMNEKIDDELNLGCGLIIEKELEVKSKEKQESPNLVKRIIGAFKNQKP